MLQLNINLDIKEDKEKEVKAKERVKAANKKKEVYVPTWEEVWITGYTRATGTRVKGIYQTKLTPSDQLKLEKVKQGIEVGMLGTGVESLAKFTKTHALGLYRNYVEVWRIGIIEKMVKEKPSNYHLIETIEEVKEVADLLIEEEVIGLDTETTGLDFDNDHIVGLSMTLPKADYHCYIPIRHVEDVIIGHEKNENGELIPIIETKLIRENVNPQEVFEILKPHLENPKLGKVLHNAKFDFHMLENDGIKVKGLTMDTKIAMQILNENEPSYALKNLATKYGKYFGFEDKSETYETLFGKGGFEKTPLDIGTVYACKDTHLTYQLYKWIDKNLRQREGIAHIYYDMENPLIEVSYAMERKGFLIDLDFANKYKEELKKQVADLEVKVVEVYGDININSGTQLATVLYDEMGLEDISKKRSTDASTIKKLADMNPELKVLLEYRELNKLLTTYIEPLPQKIWKRDGRLHGTFSQCDTVTGRFASSGPNLQNIPPASRKMFIAPKGKIFLGKDFSQIEPRMLAFLSGDKEFQKSYLEGTDLYSTLASKVFNLPIEQCGDGTKYRKMMKVGLLAVMYGTSTFTLSQQLGISLEEGEQFIEDFLNNYPQAREYMQGIRDLADSQEYIETLHGRKRRFIGHKQIAQRYHAICNKIKSINKGVMPKNIWQSKVPRDLKSAYWEVAKDYGRVERQSVNAKIQGSAADVMKLAMISVYEFLKSKGEDWNMVATVHDEIILEVPDTISEEDIEELDRRMTVLPLFDFPVKTDTVVMTRWGADDKPFKEWLKERNN